MLILVLLLPIFLLEGLVVTHLWEWFVLPLSDSIPDISVPQAAGIGLILSVFTSQFHKWGEIDPWGLLSFMIFTPLLAWLLGFILHLMM